LILLRGIWVISEEFGESLGFNAFYLFVKKEKNPDMRLRFFSKRLKLTKKL
jgi:hypothetical protein